jgi:hypothetical protein
MNIDNEDHQNEDQNGDRNPKEDLNYILLEKSNESKINELVDYFYNCNLHSQKVLLYKYINNVIETNNKNSITEYKNNELVNDIISLNKKINDITISNIAIVNNYKSKLELLSQNTSNVSNVKKNNFLLKFSTLLFTSAAAYSIYYISKKS